MTYGNYRATMYARLQRDQRRKIEANKQKANRCTAILTQVIADGGVRWAMENPDTVIKLSRQRYGMVAASIPWLSIAATILRLLLPIILQWLEEQAVQLKRGGRDVILLEDQVRQLAFESERG